jgi:membrane-bound ClpP family serine protease
MAVVGIALLLVGASLLVAEAHLPSGAFGVGGALALATGAALTIAGAGGSLVLVVAALTASLLVAGAWTGLVARTALRTRSLRAASGSEALHGRPGVVRAWNGDGGQVLVDGALWRARPSVLEPGELAIGDAVVVERVRGLTLTVRRAEEWEEA